MVTPTGAAIAAASLYSQETLPEMLPDCGNTGLRRRKAGL